MKIRLLPLAALACALGCGDVEIVTPLPSHHVQGVQEVLVKAENSTTRVRFFIDGVAEFQDDAAPFQWWWDTRLKADGSHALGVVSYDATGAINGTETYFVNVFNAADLYVHAPRYAPVFHIDANCSWRPCAVNFDGNDDWGGQTGAYNALRNAGTWPAITVYAHILPANDPADGQSGFVFDYWFYYVYNEQPANTNGTTTWNKHDHDWERALVFVPMLGGPPKFVRYFRHGWSQKHMWSAIETQAVTTPGGVYRPAVYVFNDGHGSYGTPTAPSYEPPKGGSFNPVVLTNVTVVSLLGGVAAPETVSGTGYTNRQMQRWKTFTQPAGLPTGLPTQGELRVLLGLMPDDTSTPAVGTLPLTPWNRENWSKPLQ